MSRVAVIQMKSTPDLPSNLERVERWIGAAAAEGAELVAFPENCLYLGPNDAVPLEQDQPPLHETSGTDIEPAAALRISGKPHLQLDGPEVQRLQMAANKHNIEVLIGSLPIATDDPAKTFNTSVLLYSASTGKRAADPAIYRKIHLFDVALQNGETYHESMHVTPGTELQVTRCRAGALGLSVCYDLRFPELYRGLTAMGAELLAVPAAFTYETGKEHWHALLRARAIENLCYVLAPAQAGTPYPGRRCYGHSLIIDPWGSILAEAKEDREELLVAEINHDFQRHIRQKFPVLAHRKLFTDRQRIN